MPNKVELLGISNAIVDILAQVSDDFLHEINAQPGSMMLIDESTASDLYKKMSVKKEMSGRVNINHLLAKVRDEKKKENKVNLVFFSLFASVIFVVGIILSF